MKKIALIISLLATGPALGMPQDLFLLWGAQEKTVLPKTISPEQTAAMTQRVDALLENSESLLRKELDLLKKTSHIDPSTSMCLLQGEAGAGVMFPKIFSGQLSDHGDRDQLLREQEGFFSVNMQDFIPSSERGQGAHYYEPYEERLVRLISTDIFACPWAISNSGSQVGGYRLASSHGESGLRYSDAIQALHTSTCQDLGVEDSWLPRTREFTSHWHSSPLVVGKFLLGLYHYWDGFPQIDEDLRKATLYDIQVSDKPARTAMQLDASQQKKLRDVLDGFALEALSEDFSQALPKTATLYIASLEKMEPLLVTAYRQWFGVKAALRDFLFTARTYQAVLDLEGPEQVKAFSYFQREKAKQGTPFFLNVVAIALSDLEK